MEGYYITIPKYKRKTILASYCDNILNYETKGHFYIKNLFHVQYIMPYILIQMNESIAKLVALMVEGHLNKAMEFKCNTCIVL